MLSLSHKCQVRKAGGVNRYGQTVPGRAVDAACDVIELSFEQAQTLLRADSSASRGTAKEPGRMIRFLMAFDEDVDVGDIIAFQGDQFEVMYRRPRYDVLGEPEHLEAEGLQWLE